MLANELDTAITLARKAGRSILEIYATDFGAEQKLGSDDQYEPVTEADRTSSRIIVEGLNEKFPDDATLSEEEIDDAAFRLKKNRVWIIDPLDGTAGFVKRDGDFGVQIGLAIDGVAVLGVVFLPVHDSLSYAVKGEGSWRIVGDVEPVRMTTSDKATLADLTIALSRDHPSSRTRRIVEDFGITKKVNRGSVGLKVGLITEQTCDIYIHPSPRTKLWDTCAPQIILEEAGGKFTDLFGGEMRYDRSDLQNRNGILATNAAAHSKAVQALKPLLKEFGRVPHFYSFLAALCVLCVFA